MVGVVGPGGMGAIGICIVIGMCGLATAFALIVRGRRKVGFMCLVLAFVPIYIVAIGLSTTGPTPEHKIVVDLRSAELSTLIKNTFACHNFAISESWCFAADISDVEWTLPDGQTLTMKGENLHAILDGTGKLRQFKFTIFPQPTDSELIELVRSETERQSTLASEFSFAEFKNWVDTVRLEKKENNYRYISFDRSGYRVALQIETPDASQRGYFIWYSIDLNL